MIRVDRSAVAAPPVLTGAGSLGDKERLKAIAFFSKPANKGKSFDGYKAYSDRTVKDALNRLFHGKCAYCEIGYGGAPLDVEHFRPKAALVAIDTTSWKAGKGAKKTKPAYYWLGAEWTNLLPSCIDCNRRREHEYETRAAAVTGKGNYFPLHTGHTHVLDHSRCNITAERPFLIDPCADDPQLHLKFGAGGVIMALTDRGEATIHIMGLHRDLLVRERKTIELGVLLTIAQAKSACLRLMADQQDRDAQLNYVSSLHYLKQVHLQPQSKFLAMTRQLVEEKLPSPLRDFMATLPV